MSGTKSPTPDECDRLDRFLTTPRRRFVLSYLRTRRRSVTLGELVTALDTWERVHRDTNTVTTRAEHRIGLRHVHLPVLAEADLLSFDREAELVTLTIDPDRMAESLGTPGPRQLHAGPSNSDGSS